MGYIRLQPVVHAEQTIQMAHRADAQVAPASLTKLMTALLVLESGKPLDGLVTVSLYDGTTDVATSLAALPYAGGIAQMTLGTVIPTTVLSGQRLRFTFSGGVTELALGGAPGRAVRVVVHLPYRGAGAITSLCVRGEG